MSRFKSSIFNLQPSILSLLLAAGLLGALAPRAQAVSATGGTVTKYTDVGGTNWIAHIFTNTAASTSLVFSVGGNVDVLVVAGGGGGGAYLGGGGGAGGVIFTNLTADGTNTVNVGAGGVGGTRTPAVGAGMVGTNSTFGSLVAYGGGGGGGYSPYTAPSAGGSGGGGDGAGGPGPQAGAAGTNGQGYAGGNGSGSNNGGGGGGASTNGGYATSLKGGDGGNGITNSISGPDVVYAGGGGGAGYSGNSPSSTKGLGGSGGGGDGNDASGAGSAGTDGRGGGGGSGGIDSNGGKGGSGIVIVRYLVSATPPDILNLAATNVTISQAWMNGAISFYGGAPVTAVSVYWGAADGGDPTNGLWTYTNTVTGSSSIWTNGAQVTSLATPLTQNKTYYYRFAASNSAGFAGAPSTHHFLAGNVTVTSPDGSAVWQSPSPDTGTLTIQRDASATNELVTIAYAWGGTAVQGVDYAASPAGTNVTLPAGVASTNITITPLRVASGGKPASTVWLTLLPGEYAVGTPSSNSVALGACTFDGVWKVVPGGAGSLSGTNWANAFATVQAGVDAAAVGGGDTVLVSNGTYSAAVSIAKPVTVKSVNGPLVTAMRTGDPVVLITAGDPVVVDGFTIRDGTTGVKIGGATTSAQILNCIVTRNGSSASVAGIWNNYDRTGSKLLIRNCLVSANVGTWLVAIAGNSANTITVESTTVTGNSGPNPVVASEGTMYGTNCIVFNNTNTTPENILGGDIWPTFGTWRYSCSPTLTNGTGTGNTNADPLFVAAGTGYGLSHSGGDYRLQPSSPCIDTGTILPWMATGTDLAGKPRLSGPADMGAYEWQRPAGTVVTIR